MMNTEQHEQYTHRNQSCVKVHISVLSHPPKTSKKQDLIDIHQYKNKIFQENQ